MNIVKRWEMRALKHHALKTGKTCQWKTGKIWAHDPVLKYWEIVFEWRIV